MDNSYEDVGTGYVDPREQLLGIFTAGKLVEKEQPSENPATEIQKRSALPGHGQTPLDQVAWTEERPYNKLQTTVQV